jgi:hypothetical protein
VFLYAYRDIQPHISVSIMTDTYIHIWWGKLLGKCHFKGRDEYYVSKLTHAWNIFHRLTLVKEIPVRGFGSSFHGRISASNVLSRAGFIVFTGDGNRANFRNVVFL